MKASKKKPSTKPKTKKKALGEVAKSEDRMGVGMAILSYIIPPVGVYQYFAHQDTKPKRAKIGGGLALLAVGTGLVYRLAFSK